MTRSTQLSSVVWHPYPLEKPNHRDRPQWSNEYLTTEQDLTGSRMTAVRKWDPKGKRFRVLMGDDHSIVAWAELPEPCKEETGA